MAELTSNIPAKNLTAPSSWGSRDQIKTMLMKIWNKYSQSLKFASSNSKLPVEMIVSFIAVESGGNASAGSSGHITQGLMQWNRSYAKSQLEDELAKGRMTPDEKSKLASYGINFVNGKTRDITNADQLKPELNILIGSILLGQLVDTDWGTENGQVRLDRVISVYNAGAYGDTGKKARFGNYSTPSALASAINTTSADYIKKIMGKDGALDIATSELKGLLNS